MTLYLYNENIKLPKHNNCTAHSTMECSLSSCPVVQNVLCIGLGKQSNFISVNKSAHRLDD